MALVVEVRLEVADFKAASQLVSELQQNFQLNPSALVCQMHSVKSRK